MNFVEFGWIDLLISWFQTFPFFGVVPELLTEEGQVIKGKGEGYLVSIVASLMLQYLDSWMDEMW